MLRPVFCLRAGNAHRRRRADPARPRPPDRALPQGRQRERRGVREGRRRAPAAQGRRALPARAGASTSATSAWPGMLDVAFVRSSDRARAASRHRQARRAARRASSSPPTSPASKPIRANSGLPGFQSSELPVARRRDKVRHVGELIAMCVAPTRAEAEDLAAAVRARLSRRCPPCTTCSRRCEPGAPLVHDALGRQRLPRDAGRRRSLRRQGARRRSRSRARIRTARQACRRWRAAACLANGTAGSTSSTIYSATQMPHITAPGLSECLGIDQGAIRVISPDVGGGFGYKGILLPEEIACAWLRDASSAARCAGWRTAASSSPPTPTAASTTTTSPSTPTRDGQAARASTATPRSIPARTRSIRSRRASKPRRSARSCPARTAWTATAAAPGRSATNKPPILPYRGVARTGVCFALELLMDAVAREPACEPHEVRLAQPRAAGGDAVRQHHEQALRQRRLSRRRCAARSKRSTRNAWRERQKTRRARRPPHRPRHFASSASRPRTAPRSITAGASRWCPGHEQCPARLSPDGVLELRIGAHSHGQGMETSLAQVAQHDARHRSRTTCA